MDEIAQTPTATSYPKARHGILQDLTGRTYSRWTVIAWDHRRRYEKTTAHFWKCRCACGNESVVLGGGLTNGTSTSCGCFCRERHTKHGHAGKIRHILYSIWTGLRNRCNNTENKDYYRYGAVGIKVCERWNSFDLFLDDMESGYKRGLSVDRIDTHGNYSPENCRWATKIEQSRNRFDNVYLELDGKKMLMLEWAPIVGIPYATLWARKRIGWSDSKALLTPLRTT